ncbi:unnamed protein product [Rotaria sp. Silwood2]|nr:unnamed protein product [Rotaria sp. Silwood2]
MNGIGGLHGWQWIFILIGAPIILLAIITIFFLENISDAVRWLTPAEREILTNILRDTTEQEGAQWRQVFHVFIDRKIWLFAVITMGCLAVTKYWIAFFPSLIEVLGWLASYMSGHMKRALAIGFVVGLGQIGGIVLPHFFHGNTIHVFRQAHITCAVLMAASVFATLLLRFILTERNNHNDDRPLETLETGNQNDSVSPTP